MVASEPRLVVIARVEEEVSRVTGVNPLRVHSSKQADLLEELGVDAQPDLTVRSADAFIQTAVFGERLMALRSLIPSRGNRLVRTTDRFGDQTGEIVEVTSIDRLGQVWVKGAKGYPTRPQNLARARVTNHLFGDET